VESQSPNTVTPGSFLSKKTTMHFTGKRLLSEPYSATVQFFSQALENFESTIGNESWREPLRNKAVCAATQDLISVYENYCSGARHQSEHEHK
jgi:hypothetical protein